MVAVEVAVAVVVTIAILATAAVVGSGGIRHDHLGQDIEVKLIEFLTQFGYATRKSTTVQLHAAHTHYCSDVNETKYIQG